MRVLPRVPQPMPVSPARTARAFTLIELLVVVAIIGMLMALLLPSLTRARYQSRLSVCLSNLHEIGLGIQTYAMQHNDAIPRGPASPTYFPDTNWDEMATSQLYIGQFMGAPLHEDLGLGPVLRLDVRDPRVMYCPADDTNDPVEELEKLERRGDEDAYSSYYYRQRDQVTRDRLDNLGENELGLPARALVLDANSLGEGNYHRTNHEARRVNILYLDGHAESFENKLDVFSIRAADFPMRLVRRMDEIFVAADYAEQDDPANVPPLP